MPLDSAVEGAQRELYGVHFPFTPPPPTEPLIPVPQHLGTVSIPMDTFSPFAPIPTTISGPTVAASTSTLGPHNPFSTASTSIPSPSAVAASLVTPDSVTTMPTGDPTTFDAASSTDPCTHRCASASCDSIVHRRIVPETRGAEAVLGKQTGRVLDRRGRIMLSNVPQPVDKNKGKERKVYRGELESDASSSEEYTSISGDVVDKINKLRLEIVHLKEIVNDPEAAKRAVRANATGIKKAKFLVKDTCNFLGWLVDNRLTRFLLALLVIWLLVGLGNTYRHSLAARCAPSTNQLFAKDGQRDPEDDLAIGMGMPLPDNFH
jgi:hypothetical protein